MARSHSTPAGGWKAPTRFLPSTVSIAGLAADGGVHHAEQCRRHVDHPDAAQPRRGDEAREVGGGSPAERDDGVGCG